MSDSVRPHRQQPTRLPCPWDSPGKNTGVCCHFLLQCMKVKSESEVIQSCLTLSDPMDCRLPGSSVHGIFQARVLEWGAIAFSLVYLKSENLKSVPWPKLPLSSSGSFSHSMFRVTSFWTFGFQPEIGYNPAFVTSTTVIILCLLLLLLLSRFSRV